MEDVENVDMKLTRRTGEYKNNGEKGGDLEGKGGYFEGFALISGGFWVN